MSHGVHLAAILDFVIGELRKLIISITFEPSDIDTQTIPHRSSHFLRDKDKMQQYYENKFQYKDLFRKKYTLRNSAIHVYAGC